MKVMNWMMMAISFCMAAQQLAAQTVEQWHPFDVSVTTTNTYSNPFMGVTLTGTFTGPGNKTLTIPGFYVGNNTWKIRFAPTVVGSWSYKTTSNDSKLTNVQGAVTCVANALSTVHGQLFVDASNQHHFVYEDGTRYFLMGWECDWLALMDFGDTTVPKARQLIDIYAAKDFTQVMLNVYSYDTDWRSGTTGPMDFGPPASFPWAGSYSNADQSKMNPSFFDNFDRVIDYLFQKGIVAHIYFKVYNKHVNWPVKQSADDSLYFSYVTSRYEAYPNIIWDFSKEASRDGNRDYVKAMLALIKSKDAYRRLQTVHSYGSYSTDANYNSTIDFLTDENGANLYSTVISDRAARNWPIYNAEYGYEWGPLGSGDKTYGVASSPEDVLKMTYEVLLAGGYPNYYYTYHAWDVVRYNETPAGLKYYGYLAGLFNQTKWYDLVSNDGLIGNKSGAHCLAKAGSEYIVYLSNAGSATLTISGASGQLAGTWLNAYTGQQQSAGSLGNGSQNVTSPWSNVPALLWLRSGQTQTADFWSNKGIALPQTSAEKTRTVGGVDIISLQGKLIASIENSPLHAFSVRKECLKLGLHPGEYFARFRSRGNAGVTGLEKIIIQ